MAAVLLIVLHELEKRRVAVKPDLAALRHIVYKVVERHIFVFIQVLRQVQQAIQFYGFHRLLIVIPHRRHGRKRVAHTADKVLMLAQ